MKKRFVCILIPVLLASLLCGCGSAAQKPEPEPQQSAAAAAAEQPAATAEQPAVAQSAAPEEEAVAMTDSYRAGREAYYEITGLWMPEAAGFEASFEANAAQKSICFDTQGDRALCEAAKAVLAEAFGEPTRDDGVSTVWEVPGEAEGETCIYEVYYDDHDPDDVWVYLNVHS